MPACSDARGRRARERGSRVAGQSETRDLALDCLEQICREAGLDGVSMRAVARRLGISLAALQYHFPTKAALLGAFVDRLLAGHEARLAEVLDEAPDEDRLGVAVRFVLEVSLKEAEGGLLSMIEARAHHDATAAAVVSAFRARYLRALGDIIAGLYPGMDARASALASVLVASLVDGASDYAGAVDHLGLDREALSRGVVESARLAVEAIAHPR